MKKTKYSKLQNELKSAVDFIWLQESEKPSQELQFPYLYAEMIFHLGNRFVASNPLRDVFFYKNSGGINGIKSFPEQKKLGLWNIFHY